MQFLRGVWHMGGALGIVEFERAGWVVRVGRVRATCRIMKLCWSC